MRKLVFLLALFCLPMSAQLEKLAQQLGQLGKKVSITEITLRADPGGAVRPFETLVLQARAYGKDGDKKVRLRRTGATFKPLDKEGGWVSKPFAFQGTDDEKYFEESDSQAWKIFGDVSGRFVVKDAVLYTAPEKPGKYKVQAGLEGKQTELEIEVRNDAPSRRKPERITFPAATRSSDPHRRLAERYAPFLAQETWFQPKSDTPVRFDFDGDWQGDNNWDSLDDGSSQAFVYYAAMETSTHWFLIYNVFHARDYSDRCVIGTCHENDNEGIILTILKDGSEFGRLQVMETLAHNNVYSMTNDRSIRDGLHNIDGGIEFYEDTHPAVFVESGGHGIYGTLCTQSRFKLKNGEFDEGTGMTLVYKGIAERPLHSNQKLVGYDLLSIHDEWWLKAEEGKWNQRTFDSYFTYQPFGSRPGIRNPIGSTFYGRKEAENKAKPFWGWHDTLTLKKKVLSAGQWGLDPAYAVSQNLRFPDSPAFSLDYTFNPYLGIGQAPPPQASPAPVADTQGTVGALPAAPAPPATQAEAAPEVSSGQVDLELQVDGTVDILIRGNQFEYQVHSGQPVMRDNISFSAALPAAALSSVSLSKRSGRGKATLLEKPGEANGFTTKIRVEDTRGGADTYRLRLTWQR